MTRDEYRFLRQRYEMLDSQLTASCELDIAQFQDAVYQAFIQHEGHEIFWEEATEARIARQRIFAALARHGR